tara:strand:- start:4700 stop:5491 length:792 start_codon:yes stop_codon:yes gene_type:complete
MDILSKIITRKIDELRYLKQKKSIADLEKSNYFSKKNNSIVKSIKEKDIAIIAEHKRKSPSKSDINQQTNTEKIINGYEKAGAAAISILTEKNFFGGCKNDLISAKKITELPILRKDFIFDEFQIIESKSIGADGILLIAACLEKRDIVKLSKLAKSFGMEVLIEIHNINELDKSCIESVDIIGVNNRNLKTFNVNIQTSIDLIKKIPSKYTKISESGIGKSIDLITLKNNGFDGFLIGETFMKTKDPGKTLHNFINEIENEN